MSKKSLLPFLLIIIVSFTVRFFRSTTYPPLLWDEASIGYNAYSILKTAKDEHGSFLPLIFKSFGDYKPGLYIYLTVPFVWLFGLNPLSVRLLSIITGSLTPLLIYLLIKTIKPGNQKLALLSSFLLAITPFHIHFSKAAWETNLYTFSLVLASLLFYKFILNLSNKYLLFSSLIFCLSLFIYQSAKIITPLFVLFLFLQNFNSFKPLKKHIFYFLVPIGIVYSNILFGLFFSSDANRLKVLSVFAYSPTATENQQILDASGYTRFLLFNNKYVYFLRLVLSHYFNHFSPKFLFFDGDWQNARHSTVYQGVLLLPSLLLLPLGLLKTKKDKLDLFFLFWLLVAPVPSCLSRDSISAVRSASMVIPLTYFTAKGIMFVSKFLLPVLFTFLIFYLIFLDFYFNHNLKTNPDQYLFGYHQAIDFVIKTKSLYKTIYMTDSYNQPYIFYLFYSAYPPQTYQASANLTTNSYDTGYVGQIDNIKFGPVEINQCLTQQDILCIISQNDKIRFNSDLAGLDNRLQPLSSINNTSTFYAITH